MFFFICPTFRRRETASGKYTHTSITPKHTAERAAGTLVSALRPKTKGRSVNLSGQIGKQKTALDQIQAGFSAFEVSNSTCEYKYPVTGKYFQARLACGKTLCFSTLQTAVVCLQHGR
jgi:hypothetical protein